MIQTLTPAEEAIQRLVEVMVPDIAVVIGSADGSLPLLIAESCDIVIAQCLQIELEVIHQSLKRNNLVNVIPLAIPSLGIAQSLPDDYVDLVLLNLSPDEQKYNFLLTHWTKKLRSNGSLVVPAQVRSVCERFNLTSIAENAGLILAKR